MSIVTFQGIKLFSEIKEKSADFPQLFDDDRILDFAFAVDLLTHPNELNTCLQRKGNFLHVCFIVLRHLQASYYCLYDKWKKSNLCISMHCSKFYHQIVNNYILQLRNLHVDFSYRFDDFKMIESNLNLVSAPCTFVVDKAPENPQLELIDP